MPKPTARTLLGLWLVVSSVACLVAMFLVFSQPSLRGKEPASENAIQSGEAGKGGEAAEPGAPPDAANPEARRDEAALEGLTRFGWLSRAFGLTQEQALLLLALLAGALGGSLHALQSFAAFVGNRTLRKSWFWWYLVRAPIGAILGLFFYVVLRAGLFSGESSGASPYGVVAIGALAGLFSERATRKLREVFDVLFPSTEQYADRLVRGAIHLESVTPDPLPVGGGSVSLTVTGSGFSKRSVLRLADIPLETVFLSERELEASFDPASLDPARRPAPGTKVRAVVFDPGPPERQSNARDLDVV